MTQLYTLLESQSADFNPLAEGVTALISGMLTVFLILILIAFVISRIQHIKPVGRESKKGIESATVKPQLEELPTVVSDDVDEAKEEHLDEEVVAVIMATIAASMDTTVDQLVVRSFKRLHTKRRIR